ncbi:MAG: M20 family metallopeptidase [Casimicrobiaceae bacterium]|nr:M20 family metallopeptidase [Casimicrobiaceae bacterium]MCX8097839.1 M20 family metallopeptidase [Casimicrobiaceae bacterium]
MPPPVEAILAHHAELTLLRRELHEHPELAYEERRTASLVAERLRAYGADEVHSGIGGTGVVGVIRGARAGTDAIGLRADMDCLAMNEQTGLPWASKRPGFMHACGHDGHTTMLLGAVRYLAATRRFAGTVYAVFQPAEEGRAGAKAMLEDGLLTRFPMRAIYGLHNAPWVPRGVVAVRSGPMMAAADRIEIVIEGSGGHGGMPQFVADPVLTAGHVLVAIQSIASRNVDPCDAVVVSVCAMEAGKMDTYNVIPPAVRMIGTVRTYRKEVQRLVEDRLARLVENTAAAYGCVGRVSFLRGYPATINHPREAALAAEVARELFGPERVLTDFTPNTGGEDFAFFLEAIPGAYIWVGAECLPGVGLHHARYDFDDAIIPTGAGLLAAIAERELA